jgi:hypothetical protein
MLHLRQLASAVSVELTGNVMAAPDTQSAPIAAGAIVLPSGADGQGRL